MANGPARPSFRGVDLSLPAFNAPAGYRGGSYYRDPHARTLIDMMMQNMQMGQRHAEREQQRSAQRWNMLANMPAQAYQTYLGVKDQQRAEEDRLLAEQDRLRHIAREKERDAIAAEDRAIRARTLEYGLDKDLLENLAGEDATTIQEVLGDRARTVLPDPPSAGAPLYLPDMPDLDPDRASSEGPPQVAVSQGVPQGKPLSVVATVDSPIEGRSQSFVVPTAQQAERDKYMAQQEKIIEDARIRQARIDDEVERATRLAALNEPGIEIEHVDVVDENGNTSRVGYNAQTGQRMFSIPTGRKSPSAPAAASSRAQLAAGISRALRGDPPGDFAFTTLVEQAGDPSELEALADNYRNYDQDAYLAFRESRISETPGMSSLLARVEKNQDRRGERQQVEDFERDVKEDYASIIEAYLSGPQETAAPSRRDISQEEAQLLIGQGVKVGDRFGTPDGSMVLRQHLYPSGQYFLTPAEE